MAGSKYTLIALFTLFVALTGAAQITSGKIVFERKTNLLKKFDDPQFKDFLKDNKTKIDMFELYFNDTSCVFKPQPTEEVDELSWATTRNTVYQNLNTGERMSVLDLWGNKVFVQDSSGTRQWKITDSRRNIGKYECRKAVWEKDDSTRIYAWFSVDIVPSVGPEMFSGLPGAILGLATEDGGIIYFAKEVTVQEVDTKTLTYDLGKNDIYTVEQLRAELTKRFAKQPWGQRAIDDLFRWF